MLESLLIDMSAMIEEIEITLTNDSHDSLPGTSRNRNEAVCEERSSVNDVSEPLLVDVVCINVLLSRYTVALTTLLPSLSTLSCFCEGGLNNVVVAVVVPIVSKTLLFLFRLFNS
jgi:hypothetical protein